MNAEQDYYRQMMLMGRQGQAGLGGSLAGLQGQLWGSSRAAECERAQRAFNAGLRGVVDNMSVARAPKVVFRCPDKFERFDKERPTAGLTLIEQKGETYLEQKEREERCR